MADRKKHRSQLEIDKVIHERARLLILSYLAAGDLKQAPFVELKEKLGLTAGNLSIQLRNLESAGYIRIDKSIVGRKSATDVSLTPAGVSALTDYLSEIEELIRRVKEAGEAVKGE